MAAACRARARGVYPVNPWSDPTIALVMAEKLIADNRRARHDYQLLDRFECGIVLTGTEVKSLRDGRVTLAQAYAEVRDGEAWLLGAEIAVYEQGNRANHDPTRPRKLLMHRREIERLYAQVREKGLTLVPTRLYFKDGRVKVEIALARGKDVRDKRRDRRRPRREAADGARAQGAPLTGARVGATSPSQARAFASVVAASSSVGHEGCSRRSGRPRGSGISRTSASGSNRGRAPRTSSPRARTPQSAA